MNFLSLSETNAPLAPQLIEAATRVIRSGCYLRGAETAAFESELRHQCGAGYAVGVSNGLDAIRLIIRAYMQMGRLRHGDAVLVAANTYIATVLPVTEFGLVPYFVEPDMETMNFSWKNALDILDANDSKQGNVHNIKAAIVTHLYGTPCWDQEAAMLMRDRGLVIIEDNAQAIGAVAAEEGFNGNRLTGNLADAAAFSFYPTKNVGALGDAGAVTTNDKELARTVAALANYGSDRRYHNIYVGYNCRIDEIQAAFIRVKMKTLDREIAHRQAVAVAYSENIKNPFVVTPKIFSDMVQVWHQYVILVPEHMREGLREWLAANDVATDVHYPDPPYLQPRYASYYRPSDVTPSISLSRRCISLPIANIDIFDAGEIAGVINRFTS